MKRPWGEWLFANLGYIVFGVQLFTFVLTLSLLGLIIYVAAHFIAKFW